MPEKDICIHDFCGNWNEGGHWADIIRSERVVRYGGNWLLKPDIPLPTLCTVNQAIKLANESFHTRGYEIEPFEVDELV